jgi:hypothetical protein
VTWRELGLRAGTQIVRDVWERADVARDDEGFGMKLTPHSAALVTVKTNTPA